MNIQSFKDKNPECFLTDQERRVIVLLNISADMFHIMTERGNINFSDINFNIYKQSWKFSIDNNRILFYFKNNLPF
jgi:hypothetical protein